jgi:hypothetical protein
MHKLIIALSALGLLAVSAPSVAGSCRDAQGKFIKCAKATPIKPAHCKTASGKYAKCGTLGAMRV